MLQFLATVATWPALHLFREPVRIKDVRRNAVEMGFVSRENAFVLQIIKERLARRWPQKDHFKGPKIFSLPKRITTVCLVATWKMGIVLLVSLNAQDVMKKAVSCASMESFQIQSTHVILSEMIRLKTWKSLNLKRYIFLNFSFLKFLHDQLFFLIKIKREGISNSNKWFNYFYWNDSIKIK